MTLTVLYCVASFLLGGLVMAAIITLTTVHIKRADRSMTMSEGRRRDLYITEQNK